MTARAPAPARARPRPPGARSRPPRPRRPARPRRAVPIDPRIRARRIEVAREAGRRRLRRLLLCLALASLTGTVAVAAWSPLLDVDRVVVTGAGPRTAAVRAATGVDRGSALLFLDTGAVEGRVEELPWIADARVERDLPGTVRVHVTVRAPVGYAPRPDGRVAIVDPGGLVTDVAAAPPGGLPALVTTVPPPRPGSTVTPRAAARVAAALGPLAGRVTRISVDHGEAALTLSDGLVVRLGDLGHLAEKSRAAAAVLGAAGLPPIAYVDVRVPSAPVTG
ncbi:MAG TPA: FtsQ-type POTRA domain-containing protein [Acidimicrobiia bacterium]